LLQGVTAGIYEAFEFLQCATVDDTTIEMYTASLPPESEINNNLVSNNPEFLADPTACYTARRSPFQDDKTRRTCCYPARSSLDDDTVGCYKVSHDDAEVVSAILHVTLHNEDVFTNDEHVDTHVTLHNDDAHVDAEGVSTSNPSCALFTNDELVDAHATLHNEDIFTDDEHVDPDTTKHSWVLSEHESSKELQLLGLGLLHLPCHTSVHGMMKQPQTTTQVRSRPNLILMPQGLTILSSRGTWPHFL
jgi:hypothetical protein